ncbi:MAG TPA: GNAT family N-acetyltransferase [Pyrinomonadaceae bacterium]|nr:GNAT family N-acetyltransferase [Pyrinomonadaceae bacterium]
MATPLYNPRLMNSETLPVITTPRTVLRWISEDDIDGLYAIFSDPQVVRYWSSGPLPNREAAAAMQREIADSNEKETMIKWGLALRDSNLVIGTATLFNLNLDNGRAEIGYAMGRAHWGKGYMNEALSALVSHAFEVMNLRRLEADVDPRNATSIRTLERLGFQREGFLRERWHVEGEIQDALFYGLLRREFRKP